MAVSFEEMQGSPSEQLTLQGWTATRLLKVAWTDRLAFILEIFREAYPPLSIPGLICTSATPTPFPARNKGSGSLASYDYAIVTAQYTIPALEAGIGGGAEISESIEPVAEFLTVGVDNLRWANNAGTKVAKDEAPGKLFVGFDYVIAFEGVETLPPEILDLAGHVNDKEITPTSPGMEEFKFPKETLLYNPPSIARKFDESGNPLWNLVYRYSYKPNKQDGVELGWNYYWRVDPADGVGKFVAMFGVGAAGKYEQYPLGDFGTLGI